VHTDGTRYTIACDSRSKIGLIDVEMGEFRNFEIRLIHVKNNNNSNSKYLYSALNLRR